MRIRSKPRIFSDSRIKVSLANDSVIVLSKYVKIPVNIQEIEAVVQAWLVDIKVYNLLVGVPWIQKINCTQVYRERKVTIMGKNFCVIDIPLPIILIDMDPPTIEFDKDDKTVD